MTTQQHVTWLKTWLAQRENAPSSIEEDKNYFEQGLVDSFGFLEMIFAIEKKFGIKFTESHFQDPRFSTLNGLVEIIEELIPAGDKTRS